MGGEDSLRDSSIGQQSYTMADEPPLKRQRAEMTYLAYAELVDTGEISMHSTNEVVILVSVQVRTRCCMRFPCDSCKQQTKKT